MIIQLSYATFVTLFSFSLSQCLNATLFIIPYITYSYFPKETFLISQSKQCSLLSPKKVLTAPSVLVSSV